MIQHKTNIFFVWICVFNVGVMMRQQKKRKHLLKKSMLQNRRQSLLLETRIDSTPIQRTRMQALERRRLLIVIEFLLATSHMT